MKQGRMIEMIYDWISTDIPLWFENKTGVSLFLASGSFVLSYTNISEIIKIIMLLLSALALLLNVIGSFEKRKHDKELREIQINKLKKEQEDKSL